MIYGIKYNSCNHQYTFKLIVNYKIYKNYWRHPCLVNDLMFLDGEPKSLESAVAALEPIAKEYVTKWEKEEKEPVSKDVN